MDEFDKAAYERSLKIDEEIKKEKKLLQNQMKLLLLGAADTGKSTFVRQMKIIHGSGYTEDEKREAIHTIYNNILDSAKKLIGAMKTLKFDYQDPENSVSFYALTEFVWFLLLPSPINLISRKDRRKFLHFQSLSKVTPFQVKFGSLLKQFGKMNALKTVTKGETSSS